MLLLIDLIFLIAWQIFDPIHRKLIHDVSYRLEVLRRSRAIVKEMNVQF